MTEISIKDRDILRSLAARQRELAESERNAEILKQWNALGAGRREAPTVRLLFSNLHREIIRPQMKCEGEEARRLEEQLLKNLAGRVLFDDDTPLSPTYDLQWAVEVDPFALTYEKKKDPVSGGYHIEPQIKDLGSEYEKLIGGSFGVDREKTEKERALAESVFGDILPTRMVMPSLKGTITNPLVHLMGMENYYYAMYDTPDELHKVMDAATTTYEQYYDFLEREGLLLPTCGISPINQESFAFNSELPCEGVTQTTECWGFLESQETTGVSPEMFGEFVFPYQDRLAKRFGLLSYGCCERVDAIWEDYLSKW